MQTRYIHIGIHTQAHSPTQVHSSTPDYDFPLCWWHPGWETWNEPVQCASRELDRRDFKHNTDCLPIPEFSGCRSDRVPGAESLFAYCRSIHPDTQGAETGDE